MGARNVTAKRWLVGDAVRALTSSGAITDRKDITRRFPLFATAVVSNGLSDPQILSALDRLDYLTVRKIERAMNADREEAITRRPRRRAAAAIASDSGVRTVDD